MHSVPTKVIQEEYDMWNNFYYGEIEFEEMLEPFGLCEFAEGDCWEKCPINSTACDIFVRLIEMDESDWYEYISKYLNVLKTYLKDNRSD